MNAAPPSPIPLVARLASALQEAGVVYCHWKSNAAIDLAERGEVDLDLLVARRHVRVFYEALSSCGFVAAERRHLARIPAVTDFFGYDATVDRFVHVHAHYQLVLGHDRTKNFHLPIEEAYLASVSTARVFPTPSPEFEYVVFVIRMVLKYAILDEILWNAARGRRSRPKPSELLEHAQLQGLVDAEAVAAIVREHLPFIDGGIFAGAEDVVAGNVPVWRRVAIARKVRSMLAAHTRSSQPTDAALRIWRRLVVTVRRRRRARAGYGLTTGGAIIAIMGGDGAGKSTAIAEIGHWLGGDFNVVQIHLGKPTWSWTTYAVRATLKAVHVVAFPFRRRVRPSTDNEGSNPPFPGYRRLLWLSCIARDRYREYRKAGRTANRGAIIISDRFPHPALRLMDTPQIARLVTGRPRNRFIKFLIELEERYHRRIPLPDVAFVLRLHPQEAARRKTDESHDYVVERSTEIWELDWTGYSVHVIDASRSPEAVAAELKTLIWEALA